MITGKQILHSDNEIIHAHKKIKRKNSSALYLLHFYSKNKHVSTADNQDSLRALPFTLCILTANTVQLSVRVHRCRQHGRHTGEETLYQMPSVASVNPLFIVSYQCVTDITMQILKNQNEVGWFIDHHHTGSDIKSMRGHVFVSHSVTTELMTKQDKLSVCLGALPQRTVWQDDGLT